MATNHRGHPVGENHRPTPRLVNAYRQLVRHSVGEDISPSDAQGALDDYRWDRDEHGIRGLPVDANIYIKDVVDHARGNLHPDRMEAIGEWLFPDYGGGPSGMKHDRTGYTY